MGAIERAIEGAILFHHHCDQSHRLILSLKMLILLVLTKLDSLPLMYIIPFDFRANFH